MPRPPPGRGTAQNPVDDPGRDVLQALGWYCRCEDAVPSRTDQPSPPFLLRGWLVGNNQSLELGGSRERSTEAALQGHDDGGLPATGVMTGSSDTANASQSVVPWR